MRTEDLGLDVRRFEGLLVVDLVLEVQVDSFQGLLADTTIFAEGHDFTPSRLGLGVGRGAPSQ